ncbi:MAG: hypothetical protein WCR20_17000, partial [Verrucomicrobiota bacterium]
MKPTTSSTPAIRLRKAWRPALALLAGIGLWAGCASEKHYKLLSFFFDGVPSPGATNQPARPVDENGKPLALVKTLTNQPAFAPVKFYPHP